MEEPLLEQSRCLSTGSRPVPTVTVGTKEEWICYDKAEQRVSRMERRRKNEKDTATLRRRIPV